MNVWNVQCTTNKTVHEFFFFWILNLIMSLAGTLFCGLTSHAMNSAMQHIVYNSIYYIFIIASWQQNTPQPYLIFHRKNGTHYLDLFWVLSPLGSANVTYNFKKSNYVCPFDVIEIAKSLWHSAEKDSDFSWHVFNQIWCCRKKKHDNQVKIEIAGHSMWRMVKYKA